MYNACAECFIIIFWTKFLIISELKLGITLKTFKMPQIVETKLTMTNELTLY